MDKLEKLNLPEADSYYNKNRTEKKRFHCWITTKVKRADLDTLTSNDLARVIRRGTNYLVVKMPLGILQPEMSGYQGNVYIEVVD